LIGKVSLPIGGTLQGGLDLGEANHHYDVRTDFVTKTDGSQAIFLTLRGVVESANQIQVGEVFFRKVRHLWGGVGIFPPSSETPATVQVIVDKDSEVTLVLLQVLDSLAGELRRRRPDVRLTVTTEWPVQPEKVLLTMRPDFEWPLPSEPVAAVVLEPAVCLASPRLRLVSRNRTERDREATQAVSVG
jgi:hypothetical protein